MSSGVRVERRRELPPGVERLTQACLGEGLRFLVRLGAEWDSGANRFAGPGEALFAAYDGTQLVGVCGLNRDPYGTDPAVGRLRHLYVCPSARRRGVGRALVLRALARARRRFGVVRLRTDSAEAGRFYETLGFRPAPRERNSTHVMNLGGR